MKIKKQLYGLLFLSSLLSSFIYLVYQNTVKTQIGYIYFNMLILLPFIIPIIYIYEDKIKRVDING